MTKYMFYGHEVGSYGVQHGYVDYRTLSNCFSKVLCNSITDQFYKSAEWHPELVNGNDYDEENDYPYDIYQYYIIDDRGYDILSRETDEIIYYIEALDIYIWGVCCWGTSWDYVLTDIPLSECYKIERN